MEVSRHGRAPHGGPIHPGEILREEFLELLGMSANALAVGLRVPATRIHGIVRERRAVTADTALRLARYFGTTPRPHAHTGTKRRGGGRDRAVARAEIATVATRGGGFRDRF